MFGSLKLLGVCAPPNLGLAPLQGPHRSGKCQVGAHPREIKGLLLSSSHHSLPCHTGGICPQPMRGKLSGFCRCSAVPRLELITSGHVGERGRDEIWDWGWKELCDEVEEGPAH